MEPWLYYLLFGIFFVVMMRFGCGNHVMGGHGRSHHASDRPPGEEPFDPKAEVANDGPIASAGPALLQGVMAARPIAPPRMPQRREQ